jgi:zinc D-Ala-D-Ala carboxypeptidase
MSRNDTLFWDHWTSVHDSEWPLRWFTPREVACKGSGQIKLYLPFGKLMDEIRDAYGRPIIPNSWYRSPSHNAAESDTGYDGPHTTGAAVDIRCYGKDAFALVAIATRLGVKRIGVSQKGSHEKRFVHLDMAERTGSGFPSPWIWTY